MPGKIKRPKKTQLVRYHIPVDYYIKYTYTCPHCKTRFEDNGFESRGVLMIECSHCKNIIDFRDKNGYLNLKQEESNRERVIEFILRSIKNDPSIMDELHK
jgi:hypothetical protein